MSFAIGKISNLEPVIKISPALIRRIVIVLALLFLFPTLWFGLRSYGSFQLLRSAYAAGAPETSSIRAWMTLSYVAGAYHIQLSALVDHLGLPSDTDPNTILRSAAERTKISPFQYVERVQHAVAAFVGNKAANTATENSGWLATLGDENSFRNASLRIPNFRLDSAVGCDRPAGAGWACRHSCRITGCARTNELDRRRNCHCLCVCSWRHHWLWYRTLAQPEFSRSPRTLARLHAGAQRPCSTAIQTMGLGHGIHHADLCFLSQFRSEPASGSKPLSLVRIRRCRRCWAFGMDFGLFGVGLCHWRQPAGGYRISRQSERLLVIDNCALDHGLDGRLLHSLAEPGRAAQQKLTTGDRNGVTSVVPRRIGPGRLYPRFRPDSGHRPRGLYRATSRQKRDVRPLVHFRPESAIHDRGLE